MKSGFRWRCMGLLTMVLLLWPLMAAAAPLPAERSGPTLTARGQEDQLLTLYSSYEWKNDLPGQCPTYPPIFRTGTRTVHSYCLLYTSDAADDLLCVDLGGRRIIKKKTTRRTTKNT